MSDELEMFEKAMNESYKHALKESAVGLYEIYREFINAGFDKDSALSLLIAFMQGGINGRPNQ